MSALLSCRRLSKTHGGRLLFADLSLAINAGERVGLIGPNGAGKSTLLRILAEVEQPDGGERALKKGTHLAYLPQEDVFPAGLSCEQVVHQALAAEDLDETALQTKTRIVLGKAGFADHAQQASTLSGGWRKRLALACVLVQEPDLVLLDEPTNHLDLTGIAWLEKLLANATFASLVVTHDRYFLERVANRVVEIGRHYPDGHLGVEGNYSAFLLKREVFLAAQQSRERSLANTVRREVEWLRRGPQGRGTKAKGRIKAAHSAMQELAETRARTGSGGTADIAFAATGRKTQDLVKARGLTKARGGSTLFHDLDLQLGPGDRLGLVGDNGSGKSTLLALLAEELEPDAGQVTWAKRLRRVVFHQDRAALDPELTLGETLCPEGDMITYRGKPMHVTGWAKRFQFGADQLATRVGALSGGERARLLIADLVRQPADLLLLDEPTNDLDLPTREVLEESLTEFPGAIVLVTHDRYMLERVCTTLLGLAGGNAHPLADLAQWHRLRERVTQAGKAKKPKKQPKGKKPRTGLTSKEKRELEGMEETIMAAEAAVEALQRQAEEPDVMSDHLQLQEVYTELDAAQQRVEGLYARWEALEEKKASSG